MFSICNKMTDTYLTLVSWIIFACANRVYSTCTTASDCDMSGAVCTNSACVCPADYVANGYYTKCLAVAHNYGDDCEENIQCSTGFSTGGSCTDDGCACLDEYHYFRGQCWKTAGLNESCTKDEQCWVSNDFEASVCTNEVCVCTDGYYQREYTSCRKIRGPGEPCGIDPDCQYDGGECLTNRTCSIVSNSTSNSSSLFAFREIDGRNTPSKFARSSELKDLGLIEVLAEIGESCTKDSDCPTHASCSDELCLCDAGFYPNSTESTCNPEIGSACDSDSDCLGKNTECSSENNYCVCKNGFTVSDDRRYCHKLSRHLNWSCLEDDWCAYFGPRAVCDNKKCACNASSHYVEVYVFCWIQLSVGDECRADLDCGDSDGDVTCSDNVCSCPSGSHASSDNLSCVTDASLNDACDEDDDCIDSYATCGTNSTCVCEDGYLESNGSCVAGIYGSCETDNDCTVNNTTCDDGNCTCSSDLVANEGLDECLEPVGIYENCTENAQCDNLNAECLDGECQCPEGRHYVEGYSCFESIELGETCSKNGECYVDHAECLKYTCSCEYGYTAVDGSCSGSISLFSTLNTALIFFLLLIKKIV